MIRKQLYIDEELDRRLKILAARSGRPEAEHVRAALRSYLGSLTEPEDSSQDPLLELIGLVSDREGRTDQAHEHDHYLYGSPKHDE